MKAKTTDNKMSSDMGSVLDPKTEKKNDSLKNI